MTVTLENFDHVHFVGIAGIGMSSLARLLRARGYTVSGSDANAGAQGESLRKLGIQVSSGHAAANLGSANLVVISSAVPATNEEVRAAQALGLPVLKRSELLAGVMNPARGVAIAGTHGKTTTTALLGWILSDAGQDPTIMVGGMMQNADSNARAGKGDLVVVEADEYDGSFLHLRPAVAIITNIEPEHLDFYGTADRMFDAYRRFVSGVTEALIVCADDPGADSVTRGTTATVLTYGIERGETRAEDIREKDGHLHFTVTGANASVHVVMSLAGHHNVQNALAAIVAARYFGVPDPALQTALSSFQGTSRRFEIQGEASGVTVLDDYGHHPTEIRATLAAIKQRFRRRIILVFQPHTYSRTASFLDEFGGAFGHADRLFLMDIYAARETDPKGMSGPMFADVVTRFHPHVQYVADRERAIEAVMDEAHIGDVVVTMGAGDVYQLGPHILERLAQR
ncbi:MAG: UDP-N-acetylmuramate--L-alanine ligase [Chloroflexota bacterium]